MAEHFVVSARFLAYRWYLSADPEASREEAWEFARDHWQEFVGRCYSLATAAGRSPATSTERGPSVA